jgi:uncharacterized membrane-anchored protein YjiN (DUF445 family)
MENTEHQQSGARRLAPVSLAIATALFVATLPFPELFWIAMLHAFAEAAMIGGLADWFAVVALFRHPLGLPIPHTAIIQKHRAKITSSIIDMVQNRWLAKETIFERISSWNFGQAAASWLAEQEARDTLQRMLRAVLEEVVRGMDSRRISEALSQALRDHISDEDILRRFRSVADAAMSWRWHDAALDAVLERVGPWLATPEIRALVVRNLRSVAEDYADAPLRRIGKWMAESVNALNYDDLANAILRTVGEELQKIRRDATHPARADVERWLRETVDGLESNESLRGALAKWREEVLHSGRLHEALAPKLELLRERILQDLADENSTIMKQVQQFSDQALDRFVSDEQAQEKLDLWLKERIAALIERYHGEIGAMVQRNLERLDNETLVNQIEEKVGGDLQYIRVNGALVGGLVGTALFLLKHFLSF